MGPGWDLNHCIDRWKEAMLISHKYAKKSNHILVKYEELLDDKAKILEEICKFMGIEYDDKMLVNLSRKSRQS